MTREVWRDVVGYEGLYQVSNMGRIRSLDRTVKAKNGKNLRYRGKIKPAHKCGAGYLKLILYKNGIGKNKLVHRLVAEAFIERVDGKDYVDHINGNKNDNRAENLRWVTCSENNRYVYEQGLADLKKFRAHGRNIVKKYGTPTPKKPVVRDDGVVFESITAAAKAIGASQGNVSSSLIRHGKCMGHSFRFLEPTSENGV